VKVLRHPAVYWAVALVLGGVFLYASFEKIAAPRDFAKIVYRYQLAGPNALFGVTPANVLAVTLPWLEAVIGVLLVTGLWRREAAGIAGGLLVIFIAAVSYALFQGIDIANCGCFSVAASGDGRAAGWKLIAGDAALLAAAGYLMFVKPRPRTATAEHAPAQGHDTARVPSVQG
jgi:cobalt-zinc-cadmium efflux system protein